MQQPGSQPAANLKAQRKASRRERWTARAWLWIVAHGLVPESWPGTPRIGPTTIEVTGRRSGQLRCVNATWVEANGERYLVAMMGEQSDWVHNVRASGGRATLKRGSRQNVLLEELPVAERPSILRAWYSRAGKSSIPRKYVGLPPDAPLSEFERIAPRWPVFRIKPSHDANARSA